MNLNWKVLRSGSILATRRNSISTDLRFKSRKLCFSKLADCIFRTLIFHLGAVCFAGALSKCHTVKGKLLGGVAAGHRDQFSLPARSQSGFLQREFQDPLQAPGDRRIWKFKMIKSTDCPSECCHDHQRGTKNIATSVHRRFELFHQQQTFISCCHSQLLSFYLPCPSWLFPPRHAIPQYLQPCVFFTSHQWH